MARNNPEVQAQPSGRDTRGRFVKGFCANPLGRGAGAGRRLRERRDFTSKQVREDVLFMMEEEVEVTVNGKTRKMPISSMIIQQLIHKAAGGDRLSAKMVLEWLFAMKAERTSEIGAMISFVEEWRQAEAAGQDVPKEVRELLEQLPDKIRRAPTKPA